MKYGKTLLILFILLAALFVTAKAALGAIVVDDIPDMEAIEGVEFSYEVSALYDDGTEGTFEISNGLSVLDWLSIDLENNMLLKETPVFSNIGTEEITVVVTDGVELSDENKFNLTVLPALQILNLKIDGAEWDNIEEMNVTPGQEITVEVNFQNNFNDELGHIETEALSDVNPDFVDHVGVCEGVDCENGFWAMEPSDSVSDAFTFQVPFDILADTFDVKVKVMYDDFWDFLPWVDNFEDEKTITFNVIKEYANIHLESTELDDKTLTCFLSPDLTLEITNSGSQTVVPELLVYNKEGKTFDKITGKFTQFNGGEPVIKIAETLDPIAPGITETVTLTLNLSALAEEYGDQSLFVYLVNPYFEGNTKFIAGSAEIDLTVGPCLNVEAIEDALSTSKNSGVSQEVYFFETDAEGEYLYIFEDMDYENLLLFDVNVDYEAMNTDLIDCSTDNDATTLMCGAPAGNEAGVSELLIEVTADTYPSVVEETVEVSVGNTLEVTEVKINGVSVEENGESVSLEPLQEAKFQVTFKNHLDHYVTDVGMMVFVEGEMLLITGNGESVNIAPGTTKTITLTDDLPKDIVSNIYPTNILLAGDDELNNEEIQSDSFDFDLVVELESNNLVISKAEIEEEDLEITCKTEVDLFLEITNTGSNSEDDVIISLLGNDLDDSSYSIDEEGEIEGELITIDSAEVWGDNENGEEGHYVIPTDGFNVGDNTITIEVKYTGSTSIDGALHKETEQVTVNKASCIAEENPEHDFWVLANGVTISDPVEIPNGLEIVLAEEGYDNEVVWYVNDEESENTGNTYDFSSDEDGEYEVYAQIGGEKSQTWTILVTGVPVSDSGLFPEDYFDDKDAGNVEDFTVENGFGKIVFNEAVNLNSILNIDEVISITNGQVSVDADFAPELDVPATITLKKEFSQHVILLAEEYVDEETITFGLCPEDVCQAISNENGEFVFTVPGFSTYKVVENKEANFEVADVIIADVDRGDSASVEVTISNVGILDTITEVTVALEDFSSDYNVVSSDNVPNTVNAGENFKVTLDLAVPEDENSGQHKIGEIKVSGSKNGEAVSTTANVYLNPISHLSIESVKLNGKTSGDLSVDEDNEFKVKVQNDYTEDLEDVVVTVTVLDVDNDDIEEESEEFNLDSGDDDTVEITFDLSGEDLEDDTYDVEIKVEGEADDGSEHETIEIITVDIDREDHKVIIKEVDLSTSFVECSRHSTLEITAENVGSKNEDVEVTVKNTALGLEETKEMDLDKYSGDDPKDNVKFFLDSFLANADAGSYPLTIEVTYDDGDEKETESVTIEVKNCGTTSSTSQGQNQLADDLLALQLQQQLQDQLNAQKTTVGKSSVQSSFRESSTYTLLLGVLIILVLFAMILAIAVMMKKK
jgi:hypothetical protein